MKDYIRDYATEAFRFYAANGRSAEKYKDKIRKEALEVIEARSEKNRSDIHKPTEMSLIKAEEAVNEKIAEIRDLEAIEKTISQLNIRRKDIIEAIEHVYFLNPDKELCRCDIQDRVRAAASEIPASDRSIYYWLKQARELFAKERGLRLKSLQ